MLLSVEVCFGLVMGVGPGDIIELILWVTFVDFIFFGMIVASSMWFLCNKYLALNNKSDLEWAYCFDIHINAFFAVFMILHMAQDCLINKVRFARMHFYANKTEFFIRRINSNFRDVDCSSLLAIISPRALHKWKSHVWFAKNYLEIHRHE